MTNDHLDRTESHGSAVHWFNSENDLALASGLKNYTPPKAACTIRRSGAALPLWFGDEGDTVILDTADHVWAGKMIMDFNLQTRIFSPTHISERSRPRPWGWSAYSRRFFEKLGFHESALPTHDEIELLRILSHRRTAAMIADRLKRMHPELKLADAAVECSTLEEMRTFLIENPNAYLKLPWSSSGRGVICTSFLPREKVMRFASESIHHQGSVMAERAYGKKLDFAMLFECRDSLTYSAGTSVFLTDKNGGYSGNLLSPEQERLATVERHIESNTLNKVRQSLLQIFDETIAPYYTGLFGVDMLVGPDGLLDAAVEMNLRATMGHVAAKFADRCLTPQARGVLRSLPLKSSSEFHENYQTENGKLAQGNLFLSPPTEHFAFVAEVNRITT